MRKCEECKHYANCKMVRTMNPYKAEKCKHYEDRRKKNEDKD